MDAATTENQTAAKDVAEIHLGIGGSGLSHGPPRSSSPFARGFVQTLLLRSDDALDDA
jgi:hypothetical protein